MDREGHTHPRVADLTALPTISSPRAAERGASRSGVRRKHTFPFKRDGTPFTAKSVGEVKGADHEPGASTYMPQGGQNEASREMKEGR